jgi:hypothetical protein
MDHFTDMRHRYGTGRCRFLTGLALQNEERWPEAAIELEEAVGTFLTCNDKWIEAQATDVLADVLRRAYPDRRHEANRLKASAAISFRRMAPARRNMATIAEGEVEKRDSVSRKMRGGSQGPNEHTI